MLKSVAVKNVQLDVKLLVAFYSATRDGRQHLRHGDDQGPEEQATGAPGVLRVSGSPEASNDDAEYVKDRSFAKPIEAPAIIQKFLYEFLRSGCPTPPNQRKRFFLNPKVLRSSFVPQRSSRRGASSPEPTANDNPSALSGKNVTVS